MRSLLCIGAILLYCVLFSLYILQLTNPDVPIEQKKLFYNYLNLAMLLFFYIDQRTGFESIWHKEFNLICFWTLIINYILIILNHHQLLIDPITKFWCFNTGVACVTMIVLICGKRLKMF